MINQLRNFVAAFRSTTKLFKIKNHYLPNGRQSNHGSFDAGTNWSAFLSYLLYIF